PSEAFLASLGMRLTLRRAGPGDVPRVAELMHRTHQLNTTGRVLAMDELARMCTSREHLAVVAALVDRFGAYGTIGCALASVGAARWTRRSLMVSGRVQDRGVGAALLACLVRGARRRGARFCADYARTPRNRRMYVPLKLAGFREV